MTAIADLPPGLIMMVGALFVPLFARRVQPWVVLALAAVSLVLFVATPAGNYGNFEIFGGQLNLVRIDGLSRPFGIVFHLAAIMSAIYALHVRDTRQHVSGVLYAGAAIGAACAGDLLSLFVFWELTAVSSVFLIWASDDERSYRSGMRYLIIQVASGVLLLSGAVVQYVQTGSLAFESFVGEGSELTLAGKLVLVAFGIKCAFPLLHNWLQDSYPKATVTGTVFLSAFTTKLAIYSLARGFAGFEPLIYVGCTMTLFPIVFAVIENDLRRVLAYSLNNQLGFMVVGIGIGTELAINGTVAHAFCHIIYKSLLFMSMGAVLYRVGTTKATELGGLHKSMPWTTGFCMIGAGAISGFPLLSGFVSKSMIISAAGEQHMLGVWIVLLIASAGVMEHSGIKIPFFAFFAHDSGKRVKEAPWNMLLAMGLAAFGCVALGIYYPMLYALLPYDVDYHPYTVTHVVTMLQLLMFAMLAFVVLMKAGLYPEEKRATVLDTDWFYRVAAPKMIGGLTAGITKVDHAGRAGFLLALGGVLQRFRDGFNETGLLGRTWSTNTMTFWASVMLAGTLLVYYL
ncbi:multisubunit sodium/proton antiporter, MrpD subunit [Neorhodopirellula lusitana]|uniref:Multisubunit sodium/proton antiporter, MrpD subunit n=1 Tax=Neorhodopirellula lusitana TaxID=445327 RepID=A0ABY1QDX1_9BACT|nr:Na(+)/H(+) antiporter subunit D [Neorhodopirellula lusitana]SMP68695.1 multisubunit sodium/proton antiporter, MrpD subunit [Neorhodopirellula lusitana]